MKGGVNISYSRDESGLLLLDDKNQKLLCKDLEEEEKLNEKWAKLEQEFNAWEKRNERYFLNESLSKEKANQLNKESKRYQKRFNSLATMYKDLLYKNDKEIDKVVSNHGKTNSKV